MAAVFADNPEGIVRTSGLVAGNSDYTACWWSLATAAPSDYCTFFYRGDDPVSLYVNQIWIGQAITTGTLQIYTGLLGQVNGPVLPAGPHFVAYVRSGTTHTIYIDGAVGIVVTEDTSAWVVTHQYLGTDTYTTWIPGQASRFREWNAALTVAQIQAERLSDTVVLSTGLQTNTPLATDLLDISGNGHHWAQAGGTITFSASPSIPTRFYVNSGAVLNSAGGLSGAAGNWVPHFTPANWRGTWDSVNTPGVGSVNFQLVDPEKYGGPNISLARAEVSATNPFRVGIARFTTRALTAQTVQGMFDLILGVSESNAAADFYWKVYAYVSAGQTDTVRGVLLDYEDTTSVLEWPTTATGTGLPASQALTPVVALAGDRIIVEVGYISRNSVTTARTGVLRIGSRTTVLEAAALADLTIGSTSVSTQAGALLFSIPPTLQNPTAGSPPPNTTQATAATLTMPTSLSVTPTDWKTPLWYKITVPVDTELGAFEALGAFAWANYTTAGYWPSLDIYRDPSASAPVATLTFVIAGIKQAIDWLVRSATIAAGQTYWFRIANTGIEYADTDTVTLTADYAPVIDPVPAGALFIPSDVALMAGTLLSSSTGGVQRMFDTVRGERGARLPSGVLAVAGFGIINIISSQMVVIAQTDTGFSHGSAFTPHLTADRTQFYVAQSSSGVITIKAVSAAGVIGASWTTPAFSPGLNAMGISRDGTILYLTGQNSASQGVYRFSLSSSTFLSDLIAAPGVAGSYGLDLMVLDDDTILVMRQPTGGGTHFVQRYDPSGTLLTTYTLAAGDTLNHIFPGADDPLSFWVWSFYYDPSDVTQQVLISRFTRYRSADATVLATFSRYEFDGGVGPNGDYTVPQNPASPQLFGHPNSCPLLVTLADVGEGGGGSGEACPNILAIPADSGGGSGCSAMLEPE